MAEKKIQTRIRQKVDTKANWDKATNFVPLKGEYIYYSDLHKVKVGDGVTKVGALPFLADSDTHSITGMYVGATNTKANAATTNGNTYLKLYDDNTKRAEFKIVGSGATKVSSDASGNITISSTDNDTHFTTGLYVGKADEKSNSATTNGNTYLKLFDNDTKRAQHLINGGGATTVTSNASGTIEIATPIKTLDTTSGSGLGDGRNENIAGSGTIYLHKVAKTGSYNDLVNKPKIPTNVVTIDTEQRISGKKYFENDVNFGKWVNPIRQVSDAPAKLNLMSSAQTNAGFFDTVMFAGAGDWLYLGHLKPDFSIRASFRGTGDENDTYSANLEYTHGTLNTLTDWDYQSGWAVRPTKVSTTTPAIIQIKFKRQLYTDVLRLIITGHNLNDTSSGSAYSGFLDDYTIEVCTNYTNDTWTTVVNRTNASDSIGAGLMYSLQTDSYTPCYGIRLKITKCHVTGTGYAFIKISSMQLRDYRPGIKFPDCLGAISQGGGDVWGELHTKSNLVTHNVLPYATNESYIGNANSQYWSVYSHDFYENGTALSDKYLAKGNASTNNNQVVYNPVELKKGLTGTGALVWNGNFVDTFKLNILSSDSAEEAFTYSQLSASLKCYSLTLKSTSGGSNMVLDPNTGGSISITGGSKDKYFSFANATAGTFLTTGDKGVANGVASLGSDGKVPASQLNINIPDTSTFLDKGTASTTATQTVYNPVEMKKALTVSSVQGTKYTDNSGNQQSLFELGGTADTNSGSSSLTLYRNRAGNWDSASITFTPADGLKINNYAIGVQNWSNVPASYILTNGDGVTKDSNGGVKLKSSGGASSDDFVFESTNNGKLHSKMSIGPSGLVRGGWCIDNSKIITEATLGSAVGSISSESIVSICI